MIITRFLSSNKFSIMMMTKQIFFSFLVLVSVMECIGGRKETTKVKQAGNVIVSVVEKHFQPIRTSFNVTWKIYNGENQSIHSILMKHMQSKRLSFQRLYSSDGKTFVQNESEIVVAPIIQRNETFTFSTQLILLDDEHTAHAYHIENMIVEFHWNIDGLRASTGFIQTEFPFIKKGCDKRFDVESGMLRADQVSSSFYYPSNPPFSFGGFGDGWCTLNKPSQYLQIGFEHTVTLTFIKNILYGNETKENVNKYYITYMIDGVWKDYKENGQRKYFQTSRNSIGWLLYPIKCDLVRIHPIENEQTLSDTMCMKLEIKGCQFLPRKDNCISPIGLESHKVPPLSMSDRFTKDDEFSDAHYGRANYKIENRLVGWKGTTSTEDWVQVDIGTLYKITGVGIQSGYNVHMFVKEFLFRYANDSKAASHEWSLILDNRGVEMIFKGPRDSARASYVTVIPLPFPVIGRSFRIVPTLYQIDKTLRMELYGCSVEFPKESLPSEAGDAKESTRSILVGKTNGLLIICRSNNNRRHCIESREEDQFSKWKTLPDKIKHVLALDYYGTIYGMTESNTYTMRLNASDTWYYITRNEWKKHISHNPLVTFSVDIPEILPSRTFSPNLQWAMRNDHRIFISGEGVFVRQITRSNETRLIAKWYCCGN